MEELVTRAGGNIVGRMAVLAEGAAQKRDDIIVLGDLPLLVLPPRFLDPYAPGDGTRELLCADTLSIHHYSASWLGPKAPDRSGQSK